MKVTETENATADAGPQARVRPKRLTFLKTALGIGLLVAVLVWNDNGRRLLGVFGDFRPEYLIALFLVASATNAISSVKWGLFLSDRGFRLSAWRLFELYLIGRFFSNFLPSMFGGDLARVYLAGRQISSYSISAASVVLERATGLVGLVLLALLGCLITPALLGNPLVAIPLATATLATILGVFAFFRPTLLEVGIGMADRVPVAKRLAPKLRKLLGDIDHYRTKRFLLVRSLAYSFLFHLVAALNVYVACLAIDFQPSFVEIMVITPVILLLSMIPVSPNNVGWWEWCFSVLLAGAGATAAQGLAVALVLRAVTMCLSLVGGLMLLRDQKAPPAR